MQALQRMIEICSVDLLFDHIAQSCGIDRHIVGGFGFAFCAVRLIAGFGKRDDAVELAAVDAAWEPYAAAATAQCAASVIVTALLTPFVVNWLYKYEEKKGLINYDLPLASEDTEEEAA